MGTRLTDAQLLDHVREVFEDEARLEKHYATHGWSLQQAQASAFCKLRQYLLAHEVIQK